MLGFGFPVRRAAMHCRFGGPINKVCCSGAVRQRGNGSRGRVLQPGPDAVFSDRATVFPARPVWRRGLTPAVRAGDSPMPGSKGPVPVSNQGVDADSRVTLCGTERAAPRAAADGFWRQTGESSVFGSLQSELGLNRDWPPGRVRRGISACRRLSGAEFGWGRFRQGSPYGVGGRPSFLPMAWGTCEGGVPHRLPGMLRPGSSAQGLGQEKECSPDGVQRRVGEAGERSIRGGRRAIQGGIVGSGASAVEGVRSGTAGMRAVRFRGGRDVRWEANGPSEGFMELEPSDVPWDCRLCAGGPSCPGTMCPDVRWGKRTDRIRGLACLPNPHPASVGREGAMRYNYPRGGAETRPHDL